MFPLLKYTAEEVDEYYAKVTPEMVRASLAKDRHDWFDLLNLVSPAAYPFMDEMRRKARLARIKYYGKTVSVYAPLYIGNTCVNHCRYCDFRREHTGTVRRNLTLDEIRVEAEAIRASGIDNLLIVAGEDPKVNSVEHFCDVARLLKPMFSNLSLEVAPQSEEGYRAMFEAGFESLTCFQETYDQEQYKYFHPAGPKSNYEWRLWTQLRAGKAGFRILGCAFLLGLTPWRREAASLAAHALYLMKECYESKVQFAFSDALPERADSIRFYYEGGSGTFDATTGLGVVKSKQQQWFPVRHDTQRFEIYTIPRADSDKLKVLVTTYRTVGGQVELLTEREISDIPIRQNHITICRGSLFNATEQHQISIDIDTTWDDERIEFSF